MNLQILVMKEVLKIILLLRYSSFSRGFHYVFIAFMVVIKHNFAYFCDSYRCEKVPTIDRFIFKSCRLDSTMLFAAQPLLIKFFLLTITKNQGVKNSILVTH